MSRQIDLSKPLSDSDREWLTNNGRTDLLAENDRLTSGDTDTSHTVPDEALGTSPDAQPASAGQQQAQNQQSAPTADQPAPAALGAAQAAAATDAGDGSADGDAEDNYDDAEAWSYEDLKDEVKERREEAGDGYDGPALNASREDLIVWLRKDDARD